jgi:hypothetical protein
MNEIRPVADVMPAVRAGFATAVDRLAVPR